MEAEVEEFERDLAENTSAIDKARASLLERLRILSDEDLCEGKPDRRSNLMCPASPCCDGPASRRSSD